MIPIGIEIEVLWKTDETEQAKLSGREPKLSEYALRTITIYAVIYIQPYFDEEDNDKEYTRIECAGDCYFIVPMKYNDTRNYIRRQLLSAYLS